MITVTESAKERLKSILSAKVDNPQAGLRLTVDEQGQFGLRVDVETQDDKVVKHKGSKVLLVEKGLAASLNGVTLDVEYTPEGTKLAVFKEQSSQK